MPVWLQITLGIAGSLSPVALFICALMINWVRGIQSDLAVVTKELHALRTHVAENYIRQPEMEKVVDEIAYIRRTVDGVSTMLHEMKGRLDAK